VELILEAHRAADNPSGTAPPGRPASASSFKDDLDLVAGMLIDGAIVAAHATGKTDPAETARSAALSLWKIQTH